MRVAHALLLLLPCCAGFVIPTSRVADRRPTVQLQLSPWPLAAALPPAEAAVASSPVALALSTLLAEQPDEAQQGVFAILIAAVLGIPIIAYVALDIVDLDDKRGSGKFGDDGPPKDKGLLKGVFESDLLNNKKK
jgi:hypothetical protein